MNDILTVIPSFLQGEFSVPGSKSHTIRALIAAAAADGCSEIYCPLASADTLSTADAIAELGAKVDRKDSKLWRIKGTGGRMTAPDHPIDMGNSGTGLRLLSALTTLSDSKFSFDGDSSLRTRAMQPLFDALQTLGCKIESTNGKAPFFIQGPLHGGKTLVRGISSQFLSALLFVCPLADTDITEIEVVDLCEVPYVYITLNWLERLGIKVGYSADLRHFTIPGRQKFNAFTAIMPGDFSTAAFPLAAGLLATAPGAVTLLHNLDFSDTQGDKSVFEMLKTAGGEIDIRGTDVFVRNSRNTLKPGIFDLNATPDALPVMAALFATLPAETKFVNVAQARLKECDRIRAMSQELQKMGAVIEEYPDGMSVQAPPEGLHGAADLDSHGDHRIAMALACTALTATGDSQIHGIQDAAVTYPDFVTDFRKAGADFQIHKLF